MATVSFASPRNIYQKIPNKSLGKVVKFQLFTGMHSKVIHKNIPGGGGFRNTPPG